MILQCGAQRVGVIVQVLSQEEALVCIAEVHVCHLHAFLLSASVVVLGLHLHECRPLTQ